jgi:hypothetical protein
MKKLNLLSRRGDSPINHGAGGRITEITSTFRSEEHGVQIFVDSHVRHGNIEVKLRLKNHEIINGVIRKSALVAHYRYF